jgi:hypothetical protein
MLDNHGDEFYVQEGNDEDDGMVTTISETILKADEQILELFT